MSASSCFRAVACARQEWAQASDVFAAIRLSCKNYVVQRSMGFSPSVGFADSSLSDGARERRNPLPSSDEEGVIATCRDDVRRDNVPIEFRRFIGSATGVLSLSHLRCQLPSAVALMPTASATSPRETFGFQRGAAGTLLCKVYGAYHKVKSGNGASLAFLIPH